MSVTINHAHARDNWRVRGQINMYFPDAMMDLAVEDIFIGEFESDADNTIGGELDLSYFIFDYLAVEASVGVIAGYKTATIDGDGQVNEQEDEANLFMMPGSLNLQFHFAPYGKITPYIGSGLSYTLARDGGHFSTSVGYNIQAGLDWWLNKKTGLALEVKKIYGMEAEIKPATVEGFTFFRTLKFEPTVASIGLVRRF